VLANAGAAASGSSTTGNQKIFAFMETSSDANRQLLRQYLRSVLGASCQNVDDLGQAREDAWRWSRSHGGGYDRARTTRPRSAEGALMTDWEQFGAVVLIAFGVAIAVFVVLGVAQWLLWLLS